MDGEDEIADHDLEENFNREATNDGSVHFLSSGVDLS